MFLGKVDKLGECVGFLRIDVVLGFGMRRKIAGETLLGLRMPDRIGRWGSALRSRADWKSGEPKSAYRQNADCLHHRVFPKFSIAGNLF
jgi:hypothetical protein